MARLSYKTRGNSSPQGKERVFFASHPEDFDLYFETICEDIFRTQNCVIWYDTEPEILWDSQEMETELGRMQLIVLPVTTRFLYRKNSARQWIFPFALQHHIPILPLMQESGLEEKFNRICGDLQFLDKYASRKDSTALPYEQRLERFLSSVLLGDKMAEKVRKAFDAYIFLSYRKKDRRYAQELMRLIHQNEFCRDIAIWYDEFLVPGEDFNHAIQAAMERSELFTFVVTPNLLERNNYVMTVEYPVAREMGKPLLPAEMAATDRDALRESFIGMPEPADAHSVPALSNALMKGLRNLAVEENDNDPEHLFFIGLAYLNGIDVEENRARGVNLITAAAEGGIPEAMEKMSQIFREGIGVERNYETAAGWLEKAAAYWEKRFAEEKTNENGVKMFFALLHSGKAWEDMGRLASAKHVYESMLKRFDTSPNKAVRSQIYESLAGIFEKEGNVPEARKWYEKCLVLAEQLYKEKEITANCRNLADIYGRLRHVSEADRNRMEARLWHEKQLALLKQLFSETGRAGDRSRLAHAYMDTGNMYMEENNFPEAKAWYMKSLELSEQVCKETGTVLDRMVLVNNYDRLAFVCIKEGNVPEAGKWSDKSLELNRQICRETESAVSRRGLALSYFKQGRICESEKKMKEAKRWYEQSLELSEQLCKETGLAEDQRNVALNYRGIGNVCRAERNLASAKEWYEKEMQIRKQMCEKLKTISSYEALADSYYMLGTLMPDAPDISTLRQVEAIHVFLIKHRPNEQRYVSALRTVRDKIANAEKQGQTVEELRKMAARYDQQGSGSIRSGLKLWFIARESYENSVVLRERICRETGETKDRRILAVTYVKLGDVYKAENKQAEAGKWYKKSLVRMEQLAGETDEPVDQKNLSLCQERLRSVCK